METREMRLRKVPLPVYRAIFDIQTALQREKGSMRGVTLADCIEYIIKENQELKARLEAGKPYALREPIWKDNK